LGIPLDEDFGVDTVLDGFSRFAKAVLSE